jgi:hypothetical protein
MVICTLRFTIIPICSQNLSHTRTLESHNFTIEPLPEYKHLHRYNATHKETHFQQTTKTNREQQQSPLPSSILKTQHPLIQLTHEFITIHTKVQTKPKTSMPTQSNPHTACLTHEPNSSQSQHTPTS